MKKAEIAFQLGQNYETFRIYFNKLEALLEEEGEETKEKYKTIIVGFENLLESMHISYYKHEFEEEDD